VGTSISGLRTRLDAFGFNLCAASLPGDGWRNQHDALKWQILEDLREMGARVTPEGCGLVAHLLPQVARDHFDQLPVRKRQGILPDMQAQCRPSPEAPAQATLVEMKTLHYAPSTYPASSQRCNAVARRAGAVGGEYLRKTRALDQRWHHTQQPQQGPVELRLRTYGTVRSLVFGSWAECSGDVDWLLSEAVELGLTRRRGFRPSEDDEPDGLRSMLTASLWRR
jgi:hypothetical protein